MFGRKARDVMLIRARWLPLGIPARAALARIGPLVILGALALVPVGDIRALSLALFALLLASWRPYWALLLLPLAVAFGSLAQLNVGGIHAGITDALVAGLVVRWMIERPWDGISLRWRARGGWREAWRGAWRREGRAGLAAWGRAYPLRAALFGALGAYLLVIAASALVASSRVAAAKEALKWGEVALVVALTLWLTRSAPRARGLVWALIGAGVAEALLGYAQWALSAGDLGPGGASLRVFGTFAQPNPYAGFLNFALLPALAITLWSAEPRERWLAGAAAALLVGAAMLAGSRGALLGLLAGVGVLLAVGWRRERQVGLAALVGAPLVGLAWVAGLLPASLLARLRVSDISLAGPVNDANFSSIERLAHWVAGLRMFAAHPLLGVGAGNYDAAYARYAVAGWPEPLGHAHNYYINAAAETGALGLLAFLAVAGVALVVGGRAARARSASGQASGATDRAGGRDLALGLLAVVVALLVHSLTDDLFVHAMELAFALTLGLLLALSQRESAPTRDQVRDQT